MSGKGSLMKRWLMVLVVGVWMGVPARVFAAEDAGEPGHTYPSLRSEHGLKIAGVVAEMLVKPGDHVKAGQVLLREDWGIERAELEMYRLRAESEVDVKIAIAKHDQAKEELRKYEDLYNNGRAASLYEVERARLEVLLTQHEIEKAQLDRALSMARVKQQEELLRAMELRSRIDGIVERVDVKLGQVVDPQRPAVTIVCNDPLWVECNPFSQVSLKLRIGQELDVVYEGESARRKAKVIFISPVVDPESDRHLVRLELANPEGRPSGLRVRVLLPSAELAGADAGSTRHGLR